MLVHGLRVQQTTFPIASSKSRGRAARVLGVSAAAAPAVVLLGCLGGAAGAHLATSAAPPFPRSPSGASRAPPARVGVEMQRWRCRRGSPSRPRAPPPQRAARRGCRDEQRRNARGRRSAARLPRTCANLALGEKTERQGKKPLRVTDICS